MQMLQRKGAQEGDAFKRSTRRARNWCATMAGSPLPDLFNSLQARARVDSGIAHPARRPGLDALLPFVAPLGPGGCEARSSPLATPLQLHIIRVIRVIRGYPSFARILLLIISPQIIVKESRCFVTFTCCSSFPGSFSLQSLPV